MAILRDRVIAGLRATDRKILFDTGLARGSARDFARRLRLLLPQGWFPPYRGEEEETAPILQALLTGFGAVLALSWHLMGFVRNQTRIGSTTGVFLDMAAVDFFGAAGLARFRLEKDIHFRRRMMTTLVAQRNTRSAISNAVRDITGVPPRLIEPGSVRDCGAWCHLGGYGFSQSRYGCLTGGQFFLEVVPKLPVERRRLSATLRAVKAEGVIAWIRIEGEG